MLALLVVTWGGERTVSYTTNLWLDPLHAPSPHSHGTVFRLIVPSSRLRLLSASASTGRNGVSEGTEWVRKEAPGPSTSKERDVREWRAGWKGFLLLSSIFLVGTSSHRRTLRSLLCLLGSPLLRSHFTSLRGSCGAYRIYNREFFSTSLITGVKLVGLESLRHGNRKKNKMIKE